MLNSRRAINADNSAPQFYILLGTFVPARACVFVRIYIDIVGTGKTRTMKVDNCLSRARDLVRFVIYLKVLKKCPARFPGSMTFPESAPSAPIRPVHLIPAHIPR
jgi:hypothetical protein